MKATSLYQQLQEALQAPTPTPVLLGTFGLPLVIAYLAQSPNNRPLRIGVWILAATCCVWSWLTIDLDPLLRIRIATPGMTWIFGSCLYWTFTGAVPVNHPLPRQPLLSPLRQWKPFKALDLYYNMHRHVNISGFSPPLRRLRGSGVTLYIRWVLYHLLWAALGVFMFDLSSYPIFRLAPDTLGSTACVPTGDFTTFIHDFGSRYGVPVWAVRTAFTVALGSITHFGITLIWHAFAMFSIASGIYTPEEFPTFTRWPVLATSLNELWSKRWHQLMRDFYLIVCSPLKPLPRPLYILAIFAFSGIYHLLVYYPVQRILVAYPYMLFYIGNGLACIAERAFRRVTGRRVGGVWGWLWTWAFLYVISQPLVEEEYSSGWVGCMRDVFTKEPEKSMVVGLVHALGWGPSPAEIIGQRRADEHTMTGKAS